MGVGGDAGVARPQRRRRDGSRKEAMWVGEGHYDEMMASGTLRRIGEDGGRREEGGEGLASGLGGR